MSEKIKTMVDRAMRVRASQMETVGPTKSLTLTHYTHLPVDLSERCYEQEDLSPGTKPIGLWVSVDGPDDWTEWCAAESFGIGSFPYRVTLRCDHRLLVISSLDEFDEFQKAFGRATYLARHCGIAWAEVAERYQGIIIAPYQWARRYSAFWYYGWDCASGCIWDVSAIHEWSALPPVADQQ